MKFVLMNDMLRAIVLFMLLFFINGSIFSQAKVNPAPGKSTVQTENTAINPTDEPSSTPGGGPFNVSPNSPYSFSRKTGDSEFSTAVKPVVNVTQEDITDEVKVFPNPSSGIFTIETINYCIVSLITLDGKTLWTEKITSKKTFNLPETEGIFLLKIQTNDKTSIRKIIVN